MKHRNEIDASDTNMSDIETPTQRIIQHAKPKSSCLDPLSMSLLKSAINSCPYSNINSSTPLLNRSISTATQDGCRNTAAEEKPHWIETH